MKIWTKNLKNKKGFVFILVFAAGFLIGFFAVNIYNDILNNQLPNVPNETREGNAQYSYINPLLECDTGSAISKELILFKDKLQSEIDQEIKNQKASFISVYFRDMNNGPWFGINEKEQFTPASLLKVPVMMAYLKESEANPDILNKKIKFTEPLDGDTQYFKEDGLVMGATYTVNELIEKMIIDSDNNAANLLLLNLNSSKLDDVYKYLGINLPQDQIIITVKQYATFFRILFNASYLDQDDSEKALRLLDEAKFDNGLKAGLPDSIKVSHKFGERTSSATGDNQLHDCGIVYYPNHPYLLCVMTRGNNFDVLASVIADISKFVYNKVDSQFK